MSSSLIKPLTVALCLAGALTTSGAALADELQHSQQQLELKASDLEALKAKVGAGKLVITGADIEQVIVVADIYQTDNSDIELSLKRRGDKAILKADAEAGMSLFSLSSESPYIDLEVTVPNSMLLEIEDGSGPIKISKVNNNINIKDGSGSIKIDGGADLNINDGSGSIDIRGGNTVNINDGSGSITLEQAHGNVSINDGSGSIKVEHVKGDLNINDGSGSVTVEHIAGMVTINDGSGGIDVAHTQGLNIPAAGSGSVAYEHINGPISVPSKHKRM
ncbi:hypothetical protein G3R49_09245 [Shewanella sp. WXL01]|uniref:Adhesin domain-containing protein n=1 Tax=Shewanella maritima TaxID=2520507 RepID=A0A411PJM5_9GAMM|nr:MULTISPECIES: hypothetical protein [Shewanella]NKF50754.1 hypothetical protein [Shewanella sp. WXL01]QBF83743.1 hypothetical protein EXU30_14355 [Shewanella maritima]